MFAQFSYSCFFSVEITLCSYLDIQIRGCFFLSQSVLARFFAVSCSVAAFACNCWDLFDVCAI